MTSQAKLLEGIREDNSWGANLVISLLAARRQRELMAVIVREKAEEDVEWFEEELDLSNISLPTMAEENNGLLPVFDIEEYLSIP